MIEYIFLLYYIPVTAITIYIMEREVCYNKDNLIGFMWSRASRIERLLACSVPIYRELTLLMVWIVRRNPNWLPNPNTLGIPRKYPF